MDVCTIEVQRAKRGRQRREESVDVGLPQESIAGDVARQVEVDETPDSWMRDKELNHPFTRDASASPQVEVRNLCRDRKRSQCPVCDASMGDVEMSQLRKPRQKSLKRRAWESKTLVKAQTSEPEHCRRGFHQSIHGRRESVHKGVRG